MPSALPRSSTDRVETRLIVDFYRELTRRSLISQFRTHFSVEINNLYKSIGHSIVNVSEPKMLRVLLYAIRANLPSVRIDRQEQRALPRTSVWV